MKIVIIYDFYVVLLFRMSEGYSLEFAGYKPQIFKVFIHTGWSNKVYDVISRKGVWQILKYFLMESFSLVYIFTSSQEVRAF